MELINLKMLSHPMNWFLVWIVILIASFAYKEIHRGLGGCDCGGVSPIPD